MKRFTFKGVLENFRQSVSQPTKSEQPDLIETLKSEHCQLARTARHGFPHQPTALAYDPIQRLVAIGTKSGAIRILGRPGVSVQVRHDPVADTSTAVGTSSGTGERGSLGGDRGSLTGPTSLSGVNHHSLSGTGAGASGAGLSGSSTGINAGTATGVIPGGSAASGATSGQAPSGQGSGSAGISGSASGLGPTVLQLQFLVNEGALVSATSDDILHLWNIRQKRPEIVHSLKFQRERIICFHLPFQSKWLYVGTEKGNVHVVNVESFTLSGYIINWNKAIELSCKTHPGPVIHLSDCPTDPSKLLMGYESGLIVLWDLKTKAADSRFISTEPLRSISWLSDGKQLVSAHGDGSLVTWNTRIGPRPAPVSVTYPHAKGGREGKPECKTIQKVEWKSSQSGETFLIFSGGLPQDRPGRSASITVIHGRNTTVLEMEHTVVDFVTLCDTPWASENQDPHAIIVLLQNDLVIVDLLSPGFPCFENPYPMDIHESAVTCCLYVADCPGDLIPALYSVGAQGHVGFSKREWPISGGEWGSMAPSYAELIITGHADGTVKFWDSSSLTLQVLYRLKTSKVFDKARAAGNKGALRADGDLAGVMAEPSKQHLAIKQLAMCPENRLLALAGASGHVILFKFRRQEASFETTVLDVPLFFESTEDPQGSPSWSQGGASLELCPRKEQPNPLCVRGGSYRRLPGFQADLVCLSPWMDGEAPGAITALSVNSAYGLMAFGNDGGLVLVDIFQKSVLLSMASSDLYSSADPYTRLPRSPKRPGDGTTGGNSRGGGVGSVDQSDEQSVRSPSCDQSRNGPCTSPTSASSGAGPGNRGSTGGFGGGSGGGGGSRSSGAGGDGGSSSSSSSAVAGAAGGVGGGAGGGGGSASPNARTRPEAVRRSKSQGTASHRYRDRLVRTLAFNSSCPTNPKEDDAASAVTTSSTGPYSGAGGGGTSAGGGGVGVHFGNCPESSEHHHHHHHSHHNNGREDAQHSSHPPQLAPRRNLLLLHRHQSAYTSFDKSDTAFTRSRSSSTSSLENQTNEAVTTLTFADTLARKLDTAVSASLWVGTSQGSVLVIVINLAAPGEPRLTQPVMVSPSGSIFKVKGSMLCVAFVEPSGTLISNPSEPWRDEAKETRESRSRTPTRPLNTAFSTAPPVAGASTASDSLASDNQYTVMVSEKQARVVSLPSQTCVYRVNLAPNDQTFVVTANVINLKDGPCLATFSSTGFIQVFSLPSLRPLLSMEFCPLVHLSFQTSRHNLVDPMLNIWGQQQMFVNEDSDKIARNFRFSSHGHGMYLCSPSEIEKFTISSEFVSTLGDLMGDLFLPCEMPEPPKEGFFKGLFGGGVRPLDRDELFGEATGKPSRGVARLIPGPAANLDALNYKAGSVAAEVAKTRMALNERGDKLGKLEDRTERMANEAENFSQAAHQLMVRCRDRKWYQL